MDSLIDATIETLLCREVYAARIRAAMPHGQMQHVARRAGISRQFLHRILVVDDGNGPSAEQAWPSDETAARVAGALSVDEKEAAETLRWMLQALAARRLRHTATPSRRSAERRVDKAVGQIRRVAQIAATSTCPEEGQAACRSVIELGDALIEEIDSRNHAPAVIEASLCIADALGRLGDHARALYFARRAEYVLELADGASWSRCRLKRAEFRVATSHAVGAAYAALGLVHRAMRALANARALAMEASLLRDWLPRLNGAEIQARTILRRFALKRIRGLLDESLACAREATSLDVKALRLRAAEAYLAHAHTGGRRAPLASGVLAAARELEELHSTHSEGVGWTEGLAIATLEDRRAQMVLGAGTDEERGLAKKSRSGVG